MVVGMRSRDHLLAEIERFLTLTGMTARRFGVESTGDHMLVARLRKGTDVTTGTADRIRAFMMTYRAGGAPRPRPRARARPAVA